MRGKNSIVFILVMISGLIIGGFIGSAASGIPALSFLNYGQEIGLTSPLVLDIVILKLQLGFTLKFTIAGIIGMAISIFIYRKLW
ncbi:MAG: DUF4321 domain-containing protein [Clostridiales bacterium]|nr:DUF4321 domain-containing protein [Clostridiales bacterium]MCD8214968.1 DUF4321 domain-containing protein [Clostridiales bacterium]